MISCTLPDAYLGSLLYRIQGEVVKYSHAREWLAGNLTPALADKYLDLLRSQALEMEALNLEIMDSLKNGEFIRFNDHGQPVAIGEG